MAELGQVVLSEPMLIADTAAEEFEATVREHARAVYKVAYSVVRNAHDAEDVSQEAFLRFLKHRKRWPEIRDRRAWLSKTAWRVALDLKRRAPELALEDAVEAVQGLRAQGASAEHIAAQRQTMSLLGRLIATLPRDLREVLLLSTAEELNSVEVANLLEIPEGSVRNRLMRAREMLREKLSALLERKHER